MSLAPGREKRLGVIDDWRARLSKAELALLASPAVASLPVERQLAFLRQNRRTGFWVTLLVGVSGLTLTVGGGVTALALAIQRRDGTFELVGSPVLALGLYGTWKWLNRLRQLRRPL